MERVGRLAWRREPCALALQFAKASLSVCPLQGTSRKVGGIAMLVWFWLPVCLGEKLERGSAQEKDKWEE